VKILEDDAFRETLSRNAAGWARTFTWENAARETMEIAIPSSGETHERMAAAIIEKMVLAKVAKSAKRDGHEG
jgi:hypothetical protein